MSTLQQEQDEDLANDTRASMKSAAESITRDRGKAKFLQDVGRMIGDYCGKGLPQSANLRTLCGVRLNGDSTNLTDLERAIRDAGMQVLTDYIDKVQPRGDNLSAEVVREYEQDRQIIPLLRNALSVGAEPNALRRVRDAVRKLDSESGD